MKLNFFVVLLFVILGSVPGFSKGFVVVTKNSEAGGADKIVCLQRMQTDCGWVRQNLSSYLQLIGSGGRKLSWSLSSEKYETSGTAVFCSAECSVNDEGL